MPYLVRIGKYYIGRYPTKSHAQAVVKDCRGMGYKGKASIRKVKEIPKRHHRSLRKRLFG